MSTAQEAGAFLALVEKHIPSRRTRVALTYAAIVLAFVGLVAFVAIQVGGAFAAWGLGPDRKTVANAEVGVDLIKTAPEAVITAPPQPVETPRKVERTTPREIPAKVVAPPSIETFPSVGVYVAPGAKGAMVMDTETHGVVRSVEDHGTESYISGTKAFGSPAPPASDPSTPTPKIANPIGPDGCPIWSEKIPKGGLWVGITMIGVDKPICSQGESAIVDFKSYRSRADMPPKAVKKGEGAEPAPGPDAVKP